MSTNRPWELIKGQVVDGVAHAQLVGSFTHPHNTEAFTDKVSEITEEKDGKNYGIVIDCSNLGHIDEHGDLALIYVFARFLKEQRVFRLENVPLREKLNLQRRGFTQIGLSVTYQNPAAGERSA